MALISCNLQLPSVSLASEKKTTVDMGLGDATILMNSPCFTLLPIAISLLIVLVPIFM